MKIDSDTCVIKRSSLKVYSAEGAEIEPGDRGWLTYGDHKAVKVKCLHPKGSGPGFDVDYVEYADGSIGKAKYFIHREPDSLEKLRDRMHSKWSRAWAEGEPITEEELHNFVDDLTALIERGA